MLERTIPHPISASYICEICGKEVTDVDVKSYILALALPGKNGVLSSITCPAEQHFGCCEAHAWQALIACHDEHIFPEHEKRHTAIEASEPLMQAVQQLRETAHRRAVWRLQPAGQPEQASPNS